MYLSATAAGQPGHAVFESEYYSRRRGALFKIVSGENLVNDDRRRATTDLVSKALARRFVLIMATEADHLPLYNFEGQLRAPIGGINDK
jgi:hypothetical protein